MSRAPDRGHVRFRHRVAAVLAGLACMQPAASPAMSAGAPAASATAFDTLFAEGEQQFARGEFLAAARTWTAAAEHLPADDSDNRKGLFDYIAEAYEKATSESKDPELILEALQVLDAYALNFQGAFPGVLLSEKSVTAHANLRARLAELVQAAQQPEAPEPPPPAEPAPLPSPRPWKGLAIGSGITAGAGLGMLGVFVGGYVRSKALEDQFERSRCSVGQLDGDCQDIYERGRRANIIAVAGLVAAPLLLTASVTMAVVAARRRSSHQQAFAPVLGPTMIGAVWQRRF